MAPAAEQIEDGGDGILQKSTRRTQDQAKRWWSKDTIVVVTGGNRGIGLEIVRQLVEEGLTVVLTSRDSAIGQATVKSLKAEGLQSVASHPLDVTNTESVQKFASWLKSEFGGIDILINNAAIMQFTEVSYEAAKLALYTNYYGVKYVTEGLLPLLRASPEGARIINVTGRSGLFERFSGESLKEKFRDEKNYNFNFVDSLATQYLEDVKAGHGPHEKDWPWIPTWRVPMYSDSKILMNAYTIVLEKSVSHSPDDHKIFVAGYCPGPCKTQMLTDLLATSYKPPVHDPENLHTAAEGAYTGVWLALLPKEELAGKSGKFFAEMKEFSFWLNPSY